MPKIHHVFFAAVVVAAGVVDAGCGRDNRSPRTDAGGDAAAVDAGSRDGSTNGDAGGSACRSGCASYMASCGYATSLCEGHCDCYDGWWKPEIVAAYAACQSACGGDDACAGAAGRMVTVTTEGSAFASACTSRATECGMSFPFCFAEWGSILLPSVLDAYNACLSQPCDLVLDCFECARPEACGWSHAC